jgi:hypothetical protein
VLTALQAEPDAAGEIDWRISIDSTIARVGRIFACRRPERRPLALPAAEATGDVVEQRGVLDLVGQDRCQDLQPAKVAAVLEPVAVDLARVGIQVLVGQRPRRKIPFDRPNADVFEVHPPRTRTSAQHVAGMSVAVQWAPWPRQSQGHESCRRVVEDGVVARSQRSLDVGQRADENR